MATRRQSVGIRGFSLGGSAAFTAKFKKYVCGMGYTGFGVDMSQMGLEQPVFPIHEDVSFAYSSDFADLFASADGISGLKLFYELATGTQMDKMDFAGFQVWTGSQPVSVSMRLKFYRGMFGMNNAQLEVYNPIAFLTQLTLPSKYGGVLHSPTANYWVGIQKLVSSYTAVASTIRAATLGDSSIGEGFQTLINKASTMIQGRIANLTQYRNTFHLQLYVADSKGLSNTNAGLHLPNVFLRKSEPVFAKDVDQSGFPIWGEARLEFNTQYAAHAGDIPLYPTQGNPRQVFLANDPEESTEDAHKKRKPLEDPRSRTGG